MVLTKAEIARMIDLEMLRRPSFCVRLQSRRPDRVDAHRVHGLLAFGRRPDHVPVRRGLCITPICPHTLTNRPVDRAG